ncbi:MAG TPA: hypothetical protein VGN61_00095 [Verrucomicrobiae bacterium]
MDSKLIPSLKGVKSLAVYFVILFAWAITANAWLREFFEDEVIVQRSELIAVAHLKEGSIQYVPNKSNPPLGSWEHNAILVITETIKGKSESNEIPVIIHYGLEPVIGGKVEHGSSMMDVPGNTKNYWTNPVQIFDTGNSIRKSKPIVEDASKDSIWFLRHLGGCLGREVESANNLGIVDPEDVQPLTLKEYFQAYLARNPEEAVKIYAAIHPEVAVRAQRYLNHLEVQRILKIEDPTARLDALLSHYLNNEQWDMKPEIRDGIIACGSIAGAKLIPMFNNSADSDFRDRIILLWRDMNCTNAAPILIQLLKDHDQFWVKQRLSANWWNTDPGSKLTGERRGNYGEIYDSVCALRRFHDPQAREAIELTKRRWETIRFDNPQIIEECDAALREMPGQK